MSLWKSLEPVSVSFTWMGRRYPARFVQPNAERMVRDSSAASETLRREPEKVVDMNQGYASGLPDLADFLIASRDAIQMGQLANMRRPEK